MTKAAERDQARKKRVGASLRRARDSASMTQAELGKLAGVDWTTISKIERGETSPDFATIESIADVLGLSVDDLVGRTLLAVPMPPDSAVGRPRELEARVANLEIAALRAANVDETVGVLLRLLGSAEELPGTLRDRLRAQLGAA